MIQYLLKLPLNRYVITASGIGIVGSTICIITLKYKQYSILKRPYCELALNEIKNNDTIYNLIGPSIQFKPPDLIDDRQKFYENYVNFWLPFSCSKNNGMLHIEANKIELNNNDQENMNNSNNKNWKLQRLEMKLDNIPDKLLVIYKQQQQQQSNEQIGNN